MQKLTEVIKSVKEFFSKIIKSVKEFFINSWDNLWFHVVLIISLTVIVTWLLYYLCTTIDNRCYAEAAELEQYLCQKDHTCSCIEKADYDLKFKELR